ncbi:Peptidase M10, metallopeptidase [Candidatus Methylopumilus universalis]
MHRKKPSKSLVLGSTLTLKIIILKLCQAFAVFLCLSSLTLADDYKLPLNGSNQSLTEPKNFYPYWPLKTLFWFYDPAGEPDWLEPHQGLELFKKAALAWQSCGVEIVFKGTSSSSNNILGNQINTFGWGQLPPSMRAVTYRVMKKNSPIIKEADIIVNVDNRDIQNNFTLLQKVIAHEFGHALGLTHPTSCDDVMSNASECGKRIANPPPLTPTENDLLQCYLRYIP